MTWTWYVIGMETKSIFRPSGLRKQSIGLKGLVKPVFSASLFGFIAYRKRLISL